MHEAQAAVDLKFKDLGTMKTREELLMDEIALLQEATVKAEQAQEELKR